MIPQQTQTHDKERHPADEAAPAVWLLLDERPGHRSQVQGLAEILDWPSVNKEIRFNALNHLANSFLGASLLSLDRAASDALAPPWPDLVIAMGRRSLPVARWVKKQSAGRSRLVQLGRKAANLKGAYDLAITCRHFQIPVDPAILEVAVPPTKVSARSLAAARANAPEPVADLAGPLTLFLVGGETAQHSLTPAFAEAMARAVQDKVLAGGGSLAVLNSRRTGAAATEALHRGAARAAFFDWSADQRDNPYLALLARADSLVVTGESESMLAEAAATGHPIDIYPLPEKARGWKARLQDAVLARAAAGSGGLLPSICRCLLDQGLIAPRRDLAIMHQAMVDQGYAGYFGSGARSPGASLQAERDRIKARIEALLTPSGE